MEKEAKQAIDKSSDLIQMYQAGFLDAWKLHNKGKVKLKEINQACSNGFQKRFNIYKDDNTRQKTKSKSK